MIQLHLLHFTFLIANVLIILVALVALASPHSSSWLASRKYTPMGAIEVDTYENSIFLYRSVLYVLENIPCYYSQHAGKWDPRYTNSSYSRIRRMSTGVIVTNLTSSIGYAFLSAFVDESPPGGGESKVWLFGSLCNRCGVPDHPDYSFGCDPARAGTQTWSSSDKLMQHWETSEANGTIPTYNVEVSRVTSTTKEQVAVGLPPHKYVMIVELGPDLFFTNNSPDGDLTKGWAVIRGANSNFGAPSGGPSIRWNPIDHMYYIFEGGGTVELIRTLDFATWERSANRPFIQPTARDALVSPFAGFSYFAKDRGFIPDMENATLWDWYSNDADVCCVTKDTEYQHKSYIVWGAGTQGQAPLPPLTKKNFCANVVGVANLSLPELMIAHFQINTVDN